MDIRKSIRIEIGLFLLALIAILTWLSFRGCDARAQEVEPAAAPVGQEIQDKLTFAGWQAVMRNKSVTVTLPEGEYDFTALVIPRHVSLIADPNVTRSVRLRYVGGSEAVMIAVQGGYGQTLSGFEIRSQFPVSDVIAVRFEGTINGRLSETRLYLSNCTDSIGVEIAGRESILVDRVEARATVPISYYWGDNIVLRDCDLGATGKATVLPSTVLHLVGMPQQITVDACSAQGGDHLVYGEIRGSTHGQGLNLANIRWEQSTSLGDPRKAAIHLHFMGGGMLENLYISGSRWTTRRRALSTSDIQKTTIIGSRLAGTQ